MRTRAVAEEIARAAAGAARRGRRGERARAARAGFEAPGVLARPGWAREPAAGAWLDGFRRLERRPAASRAARHAELPGREPQRGARARELRSCKPKFFVDADPWERVHAERILRGAPWIPLRRDVRALVPAARRDLELLVTFGGSDPLRSTERVLAALPDGTRVAVSCGRAHAGAPRGGSSAPRATSRPRSCPRARRSRRGWRARASRSPRSARPLYELAYLRTPALILANYDADRPVLEWYRGAGPFRPLGLARELDDAALGGELAAALAQEFVLAPRIPELGEGAANLAERLLGREPRRPGGLIPP
jgi:hypothetical protein